MGRTFQVNRNSKCKGPELEMSSVCFGTLRKLECKRHRNDRRDKVRKISNAVSHRNFEAYETARR